MVIEHKPQYFYCPDPENCCNTFRPINIMCEACDSQWPCLTKRAHHDAAYIRRIEKWVARRTRSLPIK